VSKSPLEHLEDVLAEIPNDQSYILKRELLLGVVSDSSADLRAAGTPNM
jgi:small ligand-binding sensory domain FIST